MKSATVASFCRSTFRHISPSLLALSCMVFLNVSSSRAQTVTVDKNHSAAISKQAQNLALIPVEHQKLLSSAQERILYLNTVLQGPGARGQTDSATARVAAAPAAASGPVPGPYLRVSDPRLDYSNSVMTGFTQSETSSAWCGDTIVVGYNDTGAFARTAGTGFGPWSFSSVSYSHDRGKSFTEAGYMNPGVNPINFIAGDPVVACTSSTQFYYSSIFASGQDSAGNIFDGVAINASKDGGMTWGPPVPAVAKDLNTHTIDKPWMAADPTNANRLYVAYTDFDFTGLYGDPAALCPYDIRYAIELVVSGDGGNTWSAPVTIQQECYFLSGGNAVQGSNLAVAADGTLYLGYEFYPAFSSNDEIHLATSLDHGQSIYSDLKVADVWPNGNRGVLQGGFRNNEFPQVAVDRSSSPTRGTVYIAWSDGSAHIVPDLPFYFGSYAYPDVRVASSTDKGATFSAPVTVSPVPADFTGRGRDQFFPGIAVDRKGQVGVCYYDRRQNPDNTSIDRYCSVSRDAGASWDEQRVSKFGWIAAHAADGLINWQYIGDYDALSSDFLLTHKGFFSSFEVQFNGNPDVLGSRLERDE